MLAQPVRGTGNQHEIAKWTVGLVTKGYPEASANNLWPTILVGSRRPIEWRGASNCGRLSE